MDDTQISLFWGTGAFTLVAVALTVAGWRHRLLIYALFAMATLCVVMAFAWKPILEAAPGIAGEANALATSNVSWTVLIVLGWLVALSLKFRPRAGSEWSTRIRDPQRKVEVLGSRIEGCLKTLGIALGNDNAMSYTLAMSDIEGFFLHLSRRNDLMIPELRADGEQAGCLRATKYLADMTPMLQLDDIEGAKARAAELVPKLNAMSVDQLKDMLGLNRGVGVFGGY
jgi:hypothetical protein